MSIDKQRTILLVEDEAIIAMSEKMTLINFGYNVIIAASGEEAVATVAKTPDIDLILMDIDLGRGMDGTEAAEIILEARDLPVVFLSSHVEPEIVAKTEKITSYGYVVKNSSITVLDASIKMAFKLFAAIIREKEKEKVLQDIIDKNPLSIQIVDKEGFTLKTNPAHTLLFGAVPPADFSIFNDLQLKQKGFGGLLERIKNGEIVHFPVIHYNAHDSVPDVPDVPVWIRTVVFPIYDSSGKPENFIFMHENITKSKEAEEALHASEERYRAVFDSVPVTILLTVPDGRILTANSAASRMFEMTEEEIKERGRSGILDISDPRLAPALAERERTGKFHGELTFIRKNGSRFTGEVSTVVFKDKVGNPRTSMIIEDISEKQQAEQALRESAEEFKGYFNMAAVGACVTSLEKGWIEVNDRLCRMLGYTREELLRLTWAEMTHPDDLNADLALFNQVLAGQRDSYELEKRFIRKDGRSIHTLLYVSCQRNPDRSIHHFLASLVDISELKRAAEALSQSEAHAQALLRTIPDMLFRVDRQGILLDYKADSKDLYVQSEPTLIGKRLGDIVPAGFADLLDLKTRAALETGALQTFEYQLPVPGLGVRDYEARMAVSGADEVTAIIRDITESKRAAEALRLSEVKQANALQMTKAGNWEYDVDSDIFTFNDNFYRIFRTTAAAEGGYQMSAAEYARKFCHPDDAAQVGEETRAAIASSDPDYSRQIEHRILYADGKIGTIAVRFFIVKDAQGRTIKTYGVNQDITERKRAEEEIKRQLAEKEILLKEVHHRIKNNFASIGGLLSLHLQTITSPEATAALQDAIGRVDSMRLLYDKLLLGGDFQDASVKNYIESLAASVVSLFPDLAKVKLNLDVDDFKLDPKRLFPLGIIINELLTNIMKYAFAGKKRGTIKLALTKDGARVTLNLEDDGVGLPSGFDVRAPKGFGLTLVKMLSQQLGGSFSIETHKGTRCLVEFNV